MADEVATVSSRPALGFAAVSMFVIIAAPRPWRHGAASMNAYRRILDGRRACDGRRTLGPDPRILEKEPPPRGPVAPSLERAAIQEGPAIKIVVEVAGEDEAVDQRRPEEQLLEG